MPTDMKSRHERAAERRADQARIMDEMADRLEEVVMAFRADEPGEIPRRRLLEEACYIAGIEDDYYEDESS